MKTNARSFLALARDGRREARASRRAIVIMLHDGRSCGEVAAAHGRTDACQTTSGSH